MQRTTPTLLALLALSAPAHAASKFVIRGAGFGHGVGMSQYGADGYAQHGKDYRFILGHYYTGTQVSPLVSSPTVRVLLQTGSRASFSGASAAGGRKLDPNQTYTVVPAGLGQVQLRSSAGHTLKTFSADVKVSGPGPLHLAGTQQNGLSDGRYRGSLDFKPTAVGTLEAINVVNIEDYVRGVVGAESPPSWPAAALQAQAVAARTYAITTGGGADYDQYADTRSQMYRGVSVETASTESAVTSTSGQVVTYQGKPVVTYFFSTSGGHTENIENSFIGSPPKPWLKGVSDPYDNVSPKHRWGPYTMTMSQAASKLSGLVKGKFKGIDVTQRGVSPRVVYADVVGSGGRTRVTGPELRGRFGLFDSWATFNVVSSSGQTQNPAPSTDTSAPSSDGTTGGVSPGGGGARASWYVPSGVVRGSISGAGGKRLVLQWRRGTRWLVLDRGRTSRHGRYAFAHLRPGRYRVMWRGAAGPVVTI
jgi:stage II sporulation protein D